MLNSPWMPLFFSLGLWATLAEAFTHLLELRRMKSMLMGTIAILFACTVLGQEFTPESAEECLDRFQSMYLKVNQNYALIGSAKVTSTAFPQLSKTYEWFAVENAGSNKVPRQSYSESRILYPHAPDSNVWEKRYVSGIQLQLSLGDYLEPLQDVERIKDEEEEKHLRRASIGCPNLFANAFLTSSESMLLADRTTLVGLLNQCIQFKEQHVNDDIVAKFHSPVFVKEVRFSKKAGYMPAQVKTFFRNRRKKDAPAPQDYTVLWHESETQWERVGEDTWVPVRVNNIVHRISPKSKQGLEVEATGKWQLKLDNALFSDENVKQLPVDGPIAEVRTKLLEETQEKSKVRGVNAVFSVVWKVPQRFALYMPEHLHLLVFPLTKEPDIGTYLADIKQPFSHYLRGLLEDGWVALATSDSCATGDASASKVVILNEKWLTKYNRFMRKAVEVVRAESGKTFNYAATTAATMALYRWSIMASFWDQSSHNEAIST